MNDVTPNTNHGSLNRIALSATIHCLTGCGMGEILGMVIGTALEWGTWPTVVLSVLLAFIAGYTLTMLPLLRAGIDLQSALKLAFASDTASIAIMEVVDNVLMVIIPGAMNAGLFQFRFWWSLVLALLLAGIAAYPVVRWLIARGQGHAIVHRYHSEAGEGSHNDHHH